MKRQGEIKVFVSPLFLKEKLKKFEVDEYDF